MAEIRISVTDAKAVSRYLDDAAAYYKAHSSSTRDDNRARLMSKMSRKIKTKTKKEI